MWASMGLQGSSQDRLCSGMVGAPAMPEGQHGVGTGSGCCGGSWQADGWGWHFQGSGGGEYCSVSRCDQAISGGQGGWGLWTKCPDQRELVELFCRWREEVGRVWLMVTDKGRGLSSDAFEYQKAVGWVAEIGLVARRYRNNISTWNFHQMAQFCKGYRDKCCRIAILLGLHAKRNGYGWLIVKILTEQQMGEPGRSGQLCCPCPWAEGSCGLLGRDGSARSLCGGAGLVLRDLEESLMDNAAECWDGWQIWKAVPQEGNCHHQEK